MAKFLDTPCAGQPLRFILISGTVSRCVKHIAMPVHYIYKKVVKGTTDIEHIPTESIVDTNHIPAALQPVNPGTNPILAPVLFRSYDYEIRVHFYPPAYSEHADLTNISTYNAACTVTIPILSSSDSPVDQPTEVLDASFPLPKYAVQMASKLSSCIRMWMIPSSYFLIPLYASFECLPSFDQPYITFQFFGINHNISVSQLLQRRGGDSDCQVLTSKNCDSSRSHQEIGIKVFEDFIQKGWVQDTITLELHIDT